MTSSEVREHVRQLSTLHEKCETLEDRVSKMEKDWKEANDAILKSQESNRNWILVTLGGVIVTLALELLRAWGAV
jgi:ribosomal silencing factor RsfS